jgi:hypothetical protein
VSNVPKLNMVLLHNLYTVHAGMATMRKEAQRLVQTTYG